MKKTDVTTNARKSTANETKEREVSTMKETTKATTTTDNNAVEVKPEIIGIEILTSKGAKLNIKNVELAGIVKSIDEYENGIVSNYKAICRHIYKVAMNPTLLTQDGYKNVSEFGEKVFGYSKPSVSKMIGVAKLWLESKNEKVKELSDKLGYSILSETTTLTSAEVEKAVNDGTINENTTQKQAREIVKTAKAANPSTKAKVEKVYRYDGKLSVTIGHNAEIIPFTSLTDADIVLLCNENGLKSVTAIDIIKATKDSNSKTGHTDTVRAFFDAETGAYAVAVFNRHFEETKKPEQPANVGNFTVEQLEEMLRKAREEEESNAK